MKLLQATSLSCALMASALTAQTTDVGLTMSVAGQLGPVFGQDCGAVTCLPLPGGTVPVGESRVLTHYGDSVSLFAIALGLPGPCIPLPGFDNSLLLATPFVLEFGVTSTPGFSPLPCHANSGIGQATLTIPASAPTGFVFRVQSIGVSPSSGQLAFGPAIEGTTI